MACSSGELHAIYFLWAHIFLKAFGKVFFQDLCRPDTEQSCFIAVYSITNGNDYIEVVQHHLSRLFVRR